MWPREVLTIPIFRSVSGIYTGNCADYNCSASKSAGNLETVQNLTDALYPNSPPFSMRRKRSTASCGSEEQLLEESALASYALIRLARQWPEYDE
jgi:hypothetical protein